MSTLISVIVGLAIALAGSLLWLLALFAIKPRLEVHVTGRRSHGRPAPGWALVVTNQSRVSAVQVEARLWQVVPVPGGFGTRDPIDLKRPRLFRLNGLVAARRRTDQQLRERTGGNSFRFLTDPVDLRLEDRLGEDDHLLFQVWAQHAFTNFGRVKTTIVTRAALLALLEAEQGSPPVLPAQNPKEHGGSPQLADRAEVGDPDPPPAPAAEQNT